ncbi:hypothetical protein N9M46_03570 [Gammaproteobacteria bacterium]|nr:hypothetical protein [Gammaproteobacteria bacterium]
MWVNERSLKTGLFDLDKVALPFFYLTLPNLLLVKQLGWSTLTLLSRQFTTIGIVVSVLNLALLLGNMSDPSEVQSALKFTYAPLAFGILLSYITLIYSPSSIKNLKLTPRLALFLISASVVSLIASWQSIDGATIGLIWIFDVSALIITILVLGNAYFYSGYSDLTLTERVNRGSIFVCIVAAVLGIAYYTFLISAGNPRLIGSVIALILLTILYGSMSYFISTTLGGKSNVSIKEAAYMDWHLIESYVFLTLIMLPPESILSSA